VFCTNTRTGFSILSPQCYVLSFCRRRIFVHLKASCSKFNKFRFLSKFYFIGKSGLFAIDIVAVCSCRLCPCTRPSLLVCLQNKLQCPLRPRNSQGKCYFPLPLRRHLRGMPTCTLCYTGRKLLLGLVSQLAEPVDMAYLGPDDKSILCPSPNCCPPLEFGVFSLDEIQSLTKLCSAECPVNCSFGE
jgi:hypothetical protein